MKRTMLVLALCAATPAFAAGDEGNREAKKQEYFAKMKDVELQGMRERIALLQDSAACLQGAQNYEAAKSCKERERAAMEQHQKRMKERWESNKPR
jgi:hypothetical protein